MHDVITVGEYHKYDTIVYPRGTSISKSFYANFQEKGLVMAIGKKIGSVIDSAGSAISSLFKSKKSYTIKEEEDHANFVPLDIASASKFCLQVYLEPVKMKLCEGKIQKGDCVYTMAHGAAHIFNSMSQYWISRDHAQLGPKLELKLVGSYLRLHATHLHAKWKKKIMHIPLCRYLRSGWNLYLNHLKKILSKNLRSS